MQSITPLHRCKTTTKKYNLQKEKTQKESAKKGTTQSLKTTTLKKKHKSCKVKGNANSCI